MLKIQTWWYQRGLASVIYRFFDKTSAAHIGTEINSYSSFKNQQLATRLADELHKLIIRTFDEGI